MENGQRTIGIAIWDGVEELDFAGPYEVLTAWANQSDEPIRVLTIGERAEPVRCAHGLKVIPDVAWQDVERLDVFVLPGGNSRFQVEDERFLDRVRRLAAEGTLMTSVCTGAVVYAKAGRLDGRPATTHWARSSRSRPSARTWTCSPRPVSWTTATSSRRPASPPGSTWRSI